MELSGFLSELVSNTPLMITMLLVTGVVLVNGWTDAPNAIATCVGTRSMGPKAAVVMAAVFNFLGVLVMTIINREVAQTIFKMVNFDVVISDATSNPAMVALCAALFAIVVWATAAWYFGIPTSESHALIAGLSGSAIAMGGMGGISLSEWYKVIIGLFSSTILGFAAGFFIVKIIEMLFKAMHRSRANSIFSKAQIGGSAAMAFMHGAQDGQKFIGVFIMAMFIAKGQQAVDLPPPPMWLIVFISLTMGIGTSIGGYRIIKAVGMDMVKLEKHQGFSADLAASICLLFSSLIGLPVSTTHTKTTAIMGVGAAKRISAVKWSVVKEMVYAWVLTFPGCGLIGYIMTHLFVNIFK